MAFTAKTAFEPRIVKNRTDDLCNIAGMYMASDAVADCDAGRLCVRSELTDCEGFTGIKNENSWEMVDATDANFVEDVIYACNPYEVKSVGGYFIGHETLGIGAPAGRYCAFTRIDFDGESVYRFGEGNLSTAISTNTYLTIDDGKLVPAASAPTAQGTPYFELRGTGKFHEGTRDTFTYYDVVAKTVIKAPAASA